MLVHFESILDHYSLLDFVVEARLHALESLGVVLIKLLVLLLVCLVGPWRAQG